MKIPDHLITESVTQVIIVTLYSLMEGTVFKISFRWLIELAMKYGRLQLYAQPTRNAGMNANAYHAKPSM